MTFIFSIIRSFYIKSLFSVIFFTLSSFCSEERRDSIPFSAQFNSPVYLKYLENVETHFYNILKKKNLEVDLTGIIQELAQKYIQEYEESVGNHTEEISSNPVLSIQMLSRFYKYGRMYNKNIFNTIGTNDTIDDAILPNSSDVEDAVEALFRLHYVYDLDAHDLAKGKLQGIQTTAKIPPGHCLDLGKFAMDANYFAQALQWFDVYLHKLKNGAIEERFQDLTDVMEQRVTKFIKETIDEHNKFLTELFKATGETYNHFSFTGHIHSTSYSESAHLTQRKHVVEKYFGTLPTKLSDPNDKSTFANVLGLCNGKTFQTEKVKAKLKCYLDTSSHPYWTINPLKTEVLHEAPQVIQLYDMIGDKIAEKLKKFSYERLERAPPPTNEQAFRVASYSWFEDDELPNINLIKSIEFITRLNVMGYESAELLQVAAYSPGGFVSPHYDSFNRGSKMDCPPDNHDCEAMDELLGHRVNTFLIYLNEVEKGGRTAFPHLGISIQPVKNSAVYWFTNLKNGKNDDRMLHAACPVIKGEKWIATKWTHIGTNVITFPCGLDPNE